MTNKKPNLLISSTSPYLLQHAYNPVEWHPWGEDAFQNAKTQDKPIILSIGYSSCHWCHVMEKESFENDHVAQIMNESFISIKVDREERPDVDQVYMDALQAMGMNGGWPLNIFLTPDLKPFYGGTYFPPQNWSQILLKITDIYKKRKNEVIESANQITNMLATSDIKKYQLTLSNEGFSQDTLDKAFQKLASRFDGTFGGIDKAPKFAMPSIWMFLLQYAQQTKNKIAMEHLDLTLLRMGVGGIFDQAGGGFTRYSTDKQWLVPHFEKMLYDNGQLLSLYAQAYCATKNSFYYHIMEATTAWLLREMRSEEGGFYAALDADSEGEEGKFYVFTIEELEQALPSELIILAKDYFTIKVTGNWENDKNILHAELSPKEYANAHNFDENEVESQICEIRDVLLNFRSDRERPGLDDKILTSWNALTITGFANAYKATGDEKYREIAIKTALFLKESMQKGNILLRSYSKGEARIAAYLEDYSAYIQALIHLYEITFNEEYLFNARTLLDKVIEDFYDDEESMFYFTSSKSEKLISRKKEIFDNVIPSSNSIMGNNLFLLSLYFDNKKYRETAVNMLLRMSDSIPNEPAYLSNWGILYQQMTKPTAEIVIIGKEADIFRKEIEKHYLPNKIIMGTNGSSKLPLMENRKAIEDQTTIYVCYNKACKLPVHSVEEALKQIH